MMEVENLLVEISLKKASVNQLITISEGLILASILTEGSEIEEGVKCYYHENN